jgi:hypothetical protein
MVFGNQKHADITNQPLLRHLNGEFFRHLNLPDTRLMIIGYGFGDEHINNMIVNSYALKRYPIYSLNPQGRSQLKLMNNTRFAPIYVSKPIENIPISWFTRPLSSTFNGDSVEHNMLNEFFN